jgi:hypothetical protein
MQGLQWRAPAQSFPCRIIITLLVSYKALAYFPPNHEPNQLDVFAALSSTTASNLFAVALTCLPAWWSSRFGLGLLVLPPRLGAHGIELLLGFPGFGLGLVGLLLSVHREGISRLVDVRIAERSRALPRNPLRRPSLLPCPGRGSRPSSSVWQSRHRLSPVSRCPW